MINARLSVDAMGSVRWSFAQDLALWRDIGLRHAGLPATKLADDPDGYARARAEAYGRGRA